MKPTNFAIYLRKFLTNYLPNSRGVSPQTIDSYRYSFIFLLTFFHDMMNIDADEIKISDITYKNILAYLDWLQTTRSNGIATRNQRQAAINSFLKFLMYELPEYLDEYQKILSIPTKKVPGIEISYLKSDATSLLIEMIDLKRRNGLRDYLILTIMFTTGIRVSELINIRAKDLSLSEPYTLLVHGKGNKSRFVPLMRDIVPHIKRYISLKQYDRPEKFHEFLFLNHMNTQFSRQGINYIVGKYAILAHKKFPNLIPQNFSPHKIRHTTAMSLVESGVDLIYIRDLLGHVSVKTTEVYAKADALHKRQAIERASKHIVPRQQAKWDHDSSLKKWLKSFNRR